MIWRQNPYEHGFLSVRENIQDVNVAEAVDSRLYIPVNIVDT